MQAGQSIFQLGLVWGFRSPTLRYGDPLGRCIRRKAKECKTVIPVQYGMFGQERSFQLL